MVMSLTAWILAVIDLILGGTLWALSSDEQWYRDHPGAEEKFGLIDQELEKKGE